MEKLEKTAQSEGVDLIKSTIDYHTNLMKGYIVDGNIEGLHRSADFISLANEMGARERTELKEKNKDLEGLSITDSMTGLLNRRGYENSISKEISRAARSSYKTGEANPTFGYLALDIDHFGNFNNTYGHDAGDKVLKQVANVFKEVAHRELDIITRPGGEEFCIILPDTDFAGAHKVAERINAKVSEKPMLFRDKSGDEYSRTVTISIGVTTYNPGDTEETIYKRADTLLYAAKDTGRNRVVGRAN